MLQPMRKLGRILRRLLTALSLLLSVAVLVAWVRGYWSWDTVFAGRDATDALTYRRAHFVVHSTSGEILIHYWRSFVFIETELDRGIEWEYGFRSQLPFNSGSFASELSIIWREREWGESFSKHGSLFLGRSTRAREDGTWARDFYVVFPCRLAAIVFAALPSWRFMAWWPQRRRRLLATRQGCCRSCGYDLRASPDRCPECGLEKREASHDENIEHRTSNSM